ncbi:BrnT family toxin [Methylosinus sp. LW4]|uniref:BrnT family toxin n=1 Tax=Methylosinus sp. LW4 TaxID=136993 RepID=UPI000364211E|nr:BrnT family toxin [Methylosinus sp. LW4]
MLEWDENKRIANVAKHGLDFAVAGLLFDGRPTITARSANAAEARFVTVGRIDEKFYTIIWTWRGETRRIISFRRARRAEEGAYRQVHG